MPLLDLTGAADVSFDALPAGVYPAEVFEITMDETKNPDGKVPKGTPIMKVQYKVTHPDHNNRRLFQQYTIPPEGHPADKAAYLKGMLVNFFIACGTSEKVVKSAKFDPDFEDLKGAPVRLMVAVRQYEGVARNEIKRVLAPATDEADGDGSIL